MKRHILTGLFIGFACVVYALTLRLEAKDILRMTQQEIMVDYDCSLLHQFMRHDNRRICLSLRYSL